MSKQQKMHFKEVTPLETVTKLKAILKEIGVEVTETWQQQSSIGTFALRLTFKGTTIGCNGKGVNREFALASAYAELFERYQNEMFGNIYMAEKRSEYPFFATVDEQLMTAKELISQENSYMDFYFKRRGKEKASLKEKIDLFTSVQTVDFMINNLEDKYVTVPFYSLRDNKITYLPRNIYRVSYGSNGMCAGNTFEEAIVQGISEIMERYVQKHMFRDKCTFPDIPDEYIKRFPYVYELYMKAKSNSKFRCVMKDCSMGGKYPVAALIIVEQNTGNYGVKLGCHPDYGIAMERCFTEAAQGQDITEYANRSKVDFYNVGVDDRINICNTYKVGIGQFPYQIFGRKETFPFTVVKDVASKTNVELAIEWCKEIISDGYDVLIRNVSHLGFPSAHIIIPGLSETFGADDIDYRYYNTRNLVCGLLREPVNVNKDNTKYIITILERYLTSAMDNSIEYYFSWYEEGDLPASHLGLGSLYMISMCYILNEDFSQASAKMKLFMEMVTSIRCSDPDRVSDKEYSFYQGIYYYCSARDVLKDHKLVMDHLVSILDTSILSKVYNLVEEPSQVLVRQYPSYREYLQKKRDSKASVIFDIMEKMRRAQVEYPIEQSHIEKFFKQEKVI